MKYSILIPYNNNIYSCILKINKLLKDYKFEIIVLLKSDQYFEKNSIKTIIYEGNTIIDLINIIKETSDLFPYVIIINNHSNKVLKYLEKTIKNLLMLNDQNRKYQMVILETDNTSCNCFKNNNNEYCVYAIIKNILPKGMKKNRKKIIQSNNLSKMRSKSIRSRSKVKGFN